MSKTRAVAHTASTLETGQFQSELAALVACRTDSQSGDLSALQAYLEQALTPILQSLDMSISLLPNPLPDHPPFLLATRIEDPARPTVLSYGHGDVTPGQDAAWLDGLHPFHLQQVGERLYGRGTADNKGQHLINLKALQSVLEYRGALGFNLKLLFEMGEETGSPGLDEFCTQNQELLQADVLIASDGPRLTPDVPTVFMGARGALNFDLRVDLREGAHHSGNWGGLLADPAMILAQALSTITDDRGQIRIADWRPDSLSPQIKDILAQLPETSQADADWGENALTPAERVFGWNSFAVLAMISGQPEAPVNAIAGDARATCQLRYVVGTDETRILTALREHLDSQGFEMVRIECSELASPATRLNPDHPWARFVLNSIEGATGLAPHVLPNLGGSLPNACFAETLNLPTIWIPHSYAGCNQHAPDEHLLASTTRQALELMTSLFWDIGEAAPCP